MESVYHKLQLVKQTQTEIKDGDRGCWTGLRGESKYIPADAEQKQLLQEKGIDGITYENAEPDFSPVSESSVEIDAMIDERNGKYGNYNQCDEKAAKQWNDENKDGKTWTKDDVTNWRNENKYTWHERNDQKTCDLVPASTNNYFGHLGGVSDYKKITRDEEKLGALEESNRIQHSDSQIQTRGNPLRESNDIQQKGQTTPTEAAGQEQTESKANSTDLEMN